MTAGQPNGDAGALRVAMLGSFPPQSQGIQNYCGELAEALSSLCDVTAVGYAKMYPPFLFPGVKTPMDPTRKAPAGPRLTVSHKLTYYNPLGWLWAALTTPADVFHAQWWSLPLWPVTFVMMVVMKLRRKGIVLTIHNVLPHEKKGKFVLATKVLCKLADRVLVHGETNVREFLAHYAMPEHAVRNVPMGILEPPAAPVTMADARRSLGIPHTAKTILLFGIIRSYKGIGDMLEALPKVAERIPEVRLVIAGKPWTDWAPYQAQIDRLGLGSRVDLHLGYIPSDQVPAFYAAADVVAVPYTHFNAQSAVATQSLHFKRPTLVSNVGALPECVDNDAHWVVPPGDPEALAARLVDFFGDQAAQSAAFEAVAERVLDKLSCSRIAERHVHIYAEIRKP